jgi:Family of unknown function (DUF6206)
VTLPNAAVPPPDVAAIESAIRGAIDQRRPESIDAVGNGEFSIAIRWGVGDAACVVKRVPPFSTRAAADVYVALVNEHLDDLRAQSVNCVRTDLHVLDRLDESVVVYHCQPLLAADQLADHVLRRSEPRDDHPLVHAVIDTIVRVVGNGTPVDAQFANWYWHENTIWQLDFSTPLMLDDSGDIRFDPTGFLREYPALARRLVKKELLKIAPRFGEVDYVLTDAIVQFHRQGLVEWTTPFVKAVRARHDIELSPNLAKERFDADAKFYPTLLRLKRLQRAWVQGTRRPYDTLLPTTTSFGK